MKPVEKLTRLTWLSRPLVLAASLVAAAPLAAEENAEAYTMTVIVDAAHGSKVATGKYERAIEKITAAKRSTDAYSSRRTVLPTCSTACAGDCCLRSRAGDNARRPEIAQQLLRARTGREAGPRIPGPRAFEPRGPAGRQGQHGDGTRDVPGGRRAGYRAVGTEGQSRASCQGVNQASNKGAVTIIDPPRTATSVDDHPAARISPLIDNR